MIGQRKVLVVDDRSEDRELYRRHLHCESEILSIILESSTGQQGLALWQQHQPDIILLDDQLPDLDGLEFLAELRNRTQQPLLPVIWLTRQGDENRAVQAIKAGAQDYLVKEQITPDRLHLAITTAINTLQLQAQLQLHINRERFIVDLTRRIHQSLSLDEILQIVVSEVRQFLQIDRVLIVRSQLNQSQLERLQLDQNGVADLGTVVAESVLAEGRSILSATIPDAALLKALIGQEQVMGREGESYPQNWRNLSEADELVETLYILRGLDLRLEPLPVKANLMVPIPYEEDSWGLLIAQHCTSDRLWQPGEVELLQQLTTQMSIAIRQAELYQQAQHELAERRQAEQALRRANDRFELATAAVNCLIYEWDWQTHTVERSQGLMQLVGYTPEEAGKHPDWWRERVHPEDLQVSVAKLNEIRAGSNLLRNEYRVRHRAGHYIWVEDQSVIVRDEAGQITKMVGSTREITDRKRSEIELRENRIQLEQQLAEIEAIYRTAPIGLAVLDADLRFVRINQWLAEINGYAVEDHIGHTVQELLPNLADEVYEMLLPVFETGEPRLHVELQGETPAHPGVQRTWVEHFLPLKSGDRVVAISIVCEEITDRKQMEEAREQLLIQEQLARTEAERANRIKDEFLAILSHELRSPLNPILGWAKLLQTRQFDATKTAEALAAIERNAKLLTQLIDDLLDVAKILRGKMSLSAAPVNLAFVIEAAIDTVRTAAIAKSIQIYAALPDIGQVMGDSTRLQQIIWNILSNAIKFTPPQGQVEIQLERIEDQAQITVKDTGKGINPKFRPYLFESFQQEDISTTRRYGGLGLGLAIVRHLVEAHGGMIFAESPGEGMGSTFTVRLPLLNTQAAVEVAVDPPETEPVLVGVRVLTVDDDADARELLTTLLTQYGAEVLPAASAAEVLAVLESFHPHVLISDIGMPEVDGYTLLQQIRTRSSQRGGQVPAIALTAYIGEIDQQKARHAGFQQHLAKPLDPQQVVQTILALQPFLDW